MRNYWAVIFIGILLGGCGQAGEEETSSQEVTAPTETAAEFVDRVNAELEELGKELRCLRTGAPENLLGHGRTSLGTPENHRQCHRYPVHFPAWGNSTRSPA